MYKCLRCENVEYANMSSLYKHFRVKHGHSFSVSQTKLYKIQKPKVYVYAPLTLKDTIRELQEKYMAGKLTKEQYRELRKKTLI